MSKNYDKDKILIYYYNGGLKNMEEYILKFSKVRDKTLKSIKAMNKEQTSVVKKFNAFKTKIYLSLLLEFVVKVFVISMIAVGVTTLAGINVTKYIFLIDLAIIFVFMIVYDMMYNHVKVKTSDTGGNHNQKLLNAIARLTRSYITKWFPGIFDKYIHELKSITDRLDNLHSGTETISYALSVLTYGFIQTLFDIPDDRMYYFGKESEIRKAIDLMPVTWAIEFKEAMEELKTICRAYLNDSGQFQAVLDELTMPLTLSLLQHYCRKNIISREELKDVIELDEKTEELIYKIPIMTQFDVIMT